MITFPKRFGLTLIMTNVSTGTSVKRRPDLLAVRTNLTFSPSLKRKSRLASNKAWKLGARFYWGHTRYLELSRFLEGILLFAVLREKWSVSDSSNSGGLKWFVSSNENMGEDGCCLEKLEIRCNKILFGFILVIVTFNMDMFWQIFAWPYFCVWSATWEKVC